MPYHTSLLIYSGSDTGPTLEISGIAMSQGATGRKTAYYKTCTDCDEMWYITGKVKVGSAM
jgi:hypothetical protein